MNVEFSDKKRKKTVTKRGGGGIGVPAWRGQTPDTTRGLSNPHIFENRPLRLALDLCRTTDIPGYSCPGVVC